MYIGKHQMQNLNLDMIVSNSFLNYILNNNNNNKINQKKINMLQKKKLIECLNNFNNKEIQKMIK